MAQFKIIFVEPEYQVNIGHCARVLANFGYGEMNIINPKIKLGNTAVMYSKHGKELLKKARIYKSIKTATRDCDFVVGTSGVLKRGRRVIRNPLNLEQFLEKVCGSNRRFAVLFGREGTGLVSEEIEQCDLLLSIPASRRYPTLNLSHALAIVLYGLSTTKNYRLIKNSKRDEKEKLMETFGEITDYFGPHLRNPDKIKMAFRRVLGRSLVSDLEASALLCVMKKTSEGLKRKKKL
ncbi:MAG: RNA methyltransferase [Candidatus Micrarchaeota archaeon]